MALTREEILDLIEDEFGGLSENQKLSIANDYNEANSYELFYKNNEDNLTSFCGDSLTKYFEYLRHSDEYNKNDEYFRISGYGWWHSFDSIEDELDSRALAEYVYDHWNNYESDFEMVESEIRYAEDKDEEENEEEE